MLDYVFCLMPLLCVVTIFSDYVHAIQYALMIVILALFRYFRTRTPSENTRPEVTEVMGLEEKIVRLSISINEQLLFHHFFYFSINHTLNFLEMADKKLR